MSLLELIEPKKLAEENRVLEGEIPLAQLTRCEGLFIKDQANKNLSYLWSFNLGPHKQVFSSLQIKSELKLKCQSCQQDFMYPLNIKVKMELVQTEAEAEALALDIQPLHIDAEGRCNAQDILEDELILSIPEFPRHAKKDCSFQQNEAYYEAPLSGKETNTYKPFANLNLLTRENSSAKEKK